MAKSAELSKSKTDEIVRFVQSRFRQLADPAKAGPMQAYMKTDVPFYGIQKTERTVVYREVRKQYRIESQKEYAAVIDSLWKLPHREEKYMAIQIAVGWADEFNSPAMLPAWKRTIKDGAWWDFVDDLSSRLIGQLLLEHRPKISPVMEQWIDDKDMWVRRSAILSHLRHKNETDEAQLLDFCLRRAHEKEFFIRKAIGWALRQYAYTNPAGVKNFSMKNKEKLSALSFREATKHL